MWLAWTGPLLIAFHVVCVALLQNVSSGPLDHENELYGRREDFSGRFFSLGLENRGKDRRARGVSPKGRRPLVLAP